jgi:hypothetical protein
MGYTLEDLKPRIGQRCRAFHPLQFGVIRYGTIVKVGWKWVHIEFLDGIRITSPREVLSTEQDWGET